MNFIKLVLVLLLAAQSHAADSEKDAFYEKRPSLKEAEKFFCKTSPIREIQFLESEKQMKFSLFTKMVEMGGEIAGVKPNEELSDYLDRIYKPQISYFRDIKPLLIEGGELYYVHFLTNDRTQEALGYLVLQDGNILYDDTFNLAAESKLVLKESSEAKKAGG